MSDHERASRETFYGNMVWIVDGTGFRNNFDIYHGLPDPSSEIAKDLVWAKAKRHMNGSNRGLFFRFSQARVEYPEIKKADVRAGQIYSLNEIQQDVDATYNGYHQYDWIRPRAVWLDAQCPVYIDFGNDNLVKLEVYDESGLKCVRLVAKFKFVHDVMVETHAKMIATRFYPLPEKP